MIEIVVLAIIIVGIILVLAELVTNVLPELQGKLSASPANQVKGVLPPINGDALGPEAGMGLMKHFPDCEAYLIAKDLTIMEV